MVCVAGSSLGRSFRAILPRTWGPAEKTGGRTQAMVPAKTESGLSLSLPVLDTVAPSRYVIPIAVRYDRRTLPQFSEAIGVISLP
jgi:hypothetical protein